MVFDLGCTWTAFYLFMCQHGMITRRLLLVTKGFRPYNIGQMTNKSPVLLLLILGVVLALVAVALFWFTTSKSKTASLDTFYLYKESGTVFYKLANQEYVKLEEDSKELVSGTYVKTETGLAHVVFPDNSTMSLAEDTEVQVTYDKKTINIYQTLGNTWHRVTQVVSDNEYKLETPTALATVRGTKFAVEVPTDTALPANIYVTENTVEVGQSAIENGKKVWKNRQLLTQGKFANIPKFLKERKLTIADIPREKLKSRWFERNKIFDNEFDKKRPIRTILKNTEFMKRLNEAETLDTSNIDFKLPLPELCSSLNGIDRETMLKDLLANGTISTEQYTSYLSALKVMGDACANGKLDLTESQKLIPIILKNLNYESSTSKDQN